MLSQTFVTVRDNAARHFGEGKGGVMFDLDSQDWAGREEFFFFFFDGKPDEVGQLLSSSYNTVGIGDGRMTSKKMNQA